MGLETRGGGPDTSGLDVAGMALNTGTNETQMEKISGQISTLLPPIKYFGERGGGSGKYSLNFMASFHEKQRKKKVGHEARCQRIISLPSPDSYTRPALTVEAGTRQKHFGRFISLINT